MDRTPSAISTPKWSAYVRNKPQNGHDAVVTDRMSRQQVLYQTGKQVQLVMGESARRKSVGTIETLIGQLDRLLTMIVLPSVDIGIVGHG